MIRFYDSRAERTRVILKPAELHISTTQEMLTTVLGSCVAVCLWDPETRIAGMNHFVLSHRKDSTSGYPDEAAGRFGEDAMPALLEQLERAGAPRFRLAVKLFGGAMIINKECKSNCVGDENIKTARAFLAQRGMPIVAEDVGGTVGRRIHFDGQTGRVEMERLTRFNSSIANDPIHGTSTEPSSPFERIIY